MHNELSANPSPIIGNACHSLPNWLTNWLPNSRLVNLIDVTLACEDVYSKLVEAVRDAVIYVLAEFVR